MAGQNKKKLNFVNWIKCEIYKAKDYSFTLLAKKLNIKMEQHKKSTGWGGGGDGFFNIHSISCGACDIACQIRITKVGGITHQSLQ